MALRETLMRPHATTARMRAAYGANGANGAPVVLVTGPRRDAISGVSTHVNQLFASRLAEACSLVHFVVGREGRRESVPARMLRLVTSPLVLAATIRARGVDIVHLNTALDPRSYWRDLAYMLVARICGSRVVFHVHGGALPQAFFRGSRLLTAFLRATLRLPSAIVVLARAEERAYREFVPERPAVVIPNSIDAAPYAGLSPAVRTPAAPLRLLYMGRLAPAKGLDEAIDAIDLVRRAGVQAQFVIAGNGPEEPRLRQAVARKGLAREVTFAGAVFGERKIALLRECDASLLPSYSEGLPYAVLESMAAGMPVIATAVGAIPDVIVDGVHGVLVAPRDAPSIAAAIMRLAADRGALARMGEACRERIAAHYGVERMTAELNELYARLAAPRNLRAAA